MLDFQRRHVVQPDVDDQTRIKVRVLARRVRRKVQRIASRICEHADLVDVVVAIVVNVPMDSERGGMRTVHQKLTV